MCILHYCFVIHLRILVLNTQCYYLEHSLFVLDEVDTVLHISRCGVL